VRNDRIRARDGGAAAAGTLMSFLYNLNAQQGVLFTVNAFAVVVIGGPRQLHRSGARRAHPRF